MSQQMMLLGIGAKKKTYVDDVFNTFLYKGNNSTNTFNTGLDMSGEGGLVWIKARSSARQNILFDTARGANKKLASNDNSAEWDGTGSYNQTFTSTGFTVNNSFTDVNDINVTYSSWNFRKAKGFFDVVKYTGDGTSSRQISHGLGTSVGMTIVKCSSNANYWHVLHRDGNAAKAMFLNRTDAEVNDAYAWDSTHATSTHFTVGASLNTNGRTYIAYIFAGGKNTANAAKALDFNGASHYLGASNAYTSDFSVGTGDFTIECWMNPNSYRTNGGPYGQTQTGLALQHLSSNKFGLYGAGGNLITVPEDKTPLHRWTHVAVTRAGGVLRIFINGILENTVTNNNNLDPTSAGETYIGYGSGAYYQGQLSNLRFVKGSAVYTSSFRPPTEPLTAISGTSILCCNSSTASDSSGSASLNYASALSSDKTPFNDPSGYVFGEGGDQDIIKCGSYVGNGDSSNPPEIFLGFEPSWLLIKNASAGSTSWQIFDVTRSLNAIASYRLVAEDSAAEATGASQVPISSTGFTAGGNGSFQNSNGDTFVYIAIRRPDGYVSKPAEAGTNVFNVTYGNGSSTIPSLPSAFPVDVCLYKDLGVANWGFTARMMQTKYLQTNTTAAQSSTSEHVFDSNVGCHAASWLTANDIGYLWKRCAGFDMVRYTGNGTSNHQILHNLGRTPQMIWFKRLDGVSDWMVWHHGLNGGSNNLSYQVYLNLTNAENAGGNLTALDDVSFTLNFGNGTNGNNDDMIAILFASVDGISKVGSYTGWSWPNAQAIDCGFVPRFVFIKKVTGTGGNPRDWHVFDTVRGIGGSNSSDSLIEFNNNNAEFTSSNYLDLTSSGFHPKDVDINAGPSDRFIFYAHA